MLGGVFEEVVPIVRRAGVGLEEPMEVGNEVFGGAIGGAEGDFVGHGGAGVGFEPAGHGEEGFRERLTLFSPAGVGQRADGYHLLDSQMVLLELTDRLLLLPGATGLRVEAQRAEEIPLDRGRADAAAQARLTIRPLDVPHG